MANGLYASMTELQMLNYVFSKNSTQSLVLNGIDEDYFTTYKDHYKFITSYVDEYNQLPSKETFQAKFANSFEWVRVTDPEEYLVSKLREAKLYRDLIGHYKEMGELIKSEQTDKAVEKMASISQQFLRNSQTKCIDLIDDARVRYDAYMERVNNPDSAFVSTGLKELDDIMGGWDLKNETALICARTGYGKSWWLIYFALAAAKAGLRVGYYSGEMEVDLVGYRMDTFLGNLANGSLTHGNAQIKDDYCNYIESLNKVVPGHIYCITPDMVEGDMTVSKIRAFIEKYDIEMMCVDQLSLLDDQRRARTPREQFVNISKDLRSLQRLKKIPFLIAAQLNREQDDEGPSTRHIAESDRPGQDATTVLFVERKEDNVVLTMGKARNSKTGDKLTYAWNINMGILKYQPMECDAKDGSDSVTLLSEYDDSDKSDSVF